MRSGHGSDEAALLAPVAEEELLALAKIAKSAIEEARDAAMKDADGLDVHGTCGSE